MFRQIVATTLLISLLVLEGASTTRSNDDKVVGGKSMSIMELPYQVSIQYGTQHLCGGSLLNDKMILTAAHCVDELTKKDLLFLNVVVGTTTYAVGGQRLAVSSYAKHPWFDPNTFDFDVAVIELRSRAILSKSVKPIVMADKVPKDGSQVMVSGWGYLENNDTISSPDLQAAVLHFFTRDSCTKHPHMYEESLITKSMVCAGAEGRNSCKGDSGGPLVNLFTNKLVGVVSWAYDCANKAFPTVYISVPVVKTWIENTMKKLEAQ